MITMGSQNINSLHNKFPKPIKSITLITDLTRDHQITQIPQFYVCSIWVRTKNTSSKNKILQIVSQNSNKLYNQCLMMSLVIIIPSVLTWKVIMIIKHYQATTHSLIIIHILIVRNRVCLRLLPSYNRSTWV